MAEDNTPDRDASAQPATKKKAATKKVAKKAAAASGSKKTSKKKSAARKTDTKKVGGKKTAPEKAPAKPAPVAVSAPPPPPAVEVPRAVPPPPPAAASAGGDPAYEANDESGGMSGLLVTAGPLIILAFLILVMSDDRSGDSAPRVTAPSPAQVTVDDPTAAGGGGLTEESLKGLLAADAAKELAEAFKEVGLKLPPSGTGPTSSAAASQGIELPTELRNNPWAPQQSGPAGSGETIQPPPPPAPYPNQAAGPGASRSFNPAWGYPRQMGGYNPYMAYPWQPPPAYGMPMNPYWGGAVPGYGVPQGYPPAGAYGNYQPPVAGQWAPNPAARMPAAGAPPAPLPAQQKAAP